MLMALIPQERPRTKRHARVWLVPLATLVAVGVNVFAAVEGAQAEQDRAPTLVDPADYAFSIWGLIFLANVVFAVYQAMPQQRGDAVLDRVAAPYVLGQVFATLFAVATLVDSHVLGQASTVAYFAVAVATYVILGVGMREDGWARWLCAWLPASMSAAWLLAASIVVLADVLQNDLDVSPPVGDGAAWAAFAVGLAALVAVVLLIRRRDFVFAAVVAWALVGIGREQADEVVDVAIIASLTVLGLVALGVVPRVTGAMPWRRERHAGVH